MTVLEKKSLRKKKAIMSLVEKGEYSVAYALMLVEELSDEGKLTDNDYEELAEFLEELLNEEENEEVVTDVTDDTVYVDSSENEQTNEEAE